MSFTFLVVHIRNALNLVGFSHAPVPHSKFQADFFESIFLLTANRGGENYDLVYQILKKICNHKI